MKTLAGNIAASILLFASLQVSCKKDKVTDKSLLPVVITYEVINVKHTQAECSAYCISVGSGPVTDFGICWNTTGSATIDDSCSSRGRALSPYSAKLSNLNINTTYYVRAFATNRAGTAYGNERKFKTMPLPAVIAFNPDIIYGTISDIEGNIYKTVEIGSQTWMAENLRTSRYNDNTEIEMIADNSEWSLTGKPAFCWYDNNEQFYGKVYGAYYNFFAVYTSRLCPTGWHVPSDDEWKTLEIFLGVTPDAAGNEGYRGQGISIKLKESGSGHWSKDFYPGTNESGFTALPGGSRSYFGGEFVDEMVSSGWWSSTAYYPIGGVGYSRSLSFEYPGIKRELITLNQGLNVRCVKD